MSPAATPTPFWQVDAFADRPFAGNPAAVVWLDAPRDAAWMQAVANEMQLSETAFLSPASDGYHLRWFTPATEVDLCGHATLAAAHALWESGRLAPGRQARFHTRSGLLTADQEGEWIVLDFPATPPESCPVPAGLVEGFGATPIWVGRSPWDVVARFEDPAVVRNLVPDLSQIAQIPARGVIVTAPGDREGIDFISRWFGPQIDVPEDPVTGSAHCALGPFWGDRLGKTAMVAEQASRRGGIVRVELQGDRVRLGGKAVTVLRGGLLA